MEQNEVNLSVPSLTTFRVSVVACSAPVGFFPASFPSMRHSGSWVCHPGTPRLPPRFGSGRVPIQIGPPHKIPPHSTPGPRRDELTRNPPSLGSGGTHLRQLWTRRAQDARCNMPCTNPDAALDSICSLPANLSTRDWASSRFPSSI